MRSPQHIKISFRYLLLGLSAILFLITTACSPKPTPLPTVTPLPVDPNKGSVTGVLLVQAGPAPKPVAGALLYLASVLKGPDGVERAARFSRTESPRTTADEQGHFTFVNIPPGRYGLVLDTVMAAYLLFTPGTQEGIIITVSAGSNTDLGELAYDTLPIPGLLATPAANPTILPYPPPPVTPTSSSYP